MATVKVITPPPVIPPPVTIELNLSWDEFRIIHTALGRCGPPHLIQDGSNPLPEHVANKAYDLYTTLNNAKKKVNG